MGHIKEPKGVDFVIKSKPLTSEERKAISEFIVQYKSKNSSKKFSVKRRRKAAAKKTKA